MSDEVEILVREPLDADRQREIANARSDVIRRAKAQGVESFTSLEDFSGDASITDDFDVDAFLRQVREDRDRPSSWGTIF